MLFKLILCCAISLSASKALITKSETHENAVSNAASLKIEKTNEERQTILSYEDVLRSYYQKVLEKYLKQVVDEDQEALEEIIYKINSVDYNKNEPRLVKHSPEVRDLVSKLLDKDTEKRYSAKEALNHPWFKKYGGRALFSNFDEEEIKPYINNLLKYTFNSKIQQLVIAFLVHNLPNTDTSTLILKLFRHFNKSGNCKLTKEEFGSFMAFTKSILGNIKDF